VELAVRTEGRIKTVPFTTLRNFKPKSKIYKASDRDGMYVTVSPSGTVTFRYDYRLNGRRETLTFRRHGSDGISLAMARELLLDARKAVLKGVSPALEKQREKRRVGAIRTFGAALEPWLANARWADSTRAARQHIVGRDLSAFPEPLTDRNSGRRPAGPLHQDQGAWGACHCGSTSGHREAGLCLCDRSR